VSRPQITIVALISDGSHLVLNNRGAGWDDFRARALMDILDTLLASPGPGAHVISIVIAHESHFHLVHGQGKVFALLSGALIMPASTQTAH
jgi:hypothetical protein